MTSASGTPADFNLLSSGAADANKTSVSSPVEFPCSPVAVSFYDSLISINFIMIHYVSMSCFFPILQILQALIRRSVRRPRQLVPPPLAQTSRSSLWREE